MKDQVLVAYATKHGGTAEIAEKIGEVLHQAGLPADVLPVKQVNDLTPYTAVVLTAPCTSADGAKRRSSS